jgi:hypothetical protein
METNTFLPKQYFISGIIVIYLTFSAVDRGFEPPSGQTKDYKIGICCISVKYTALRRKRKDLLVLNQDNVSEWRDMNYQVIVYNKQRLIQVRQKLARFQKGKQ